MSDPIERRAGLDACDLMPNEDFWLHLKSRDDGTVEVIDQNGRKLRGVIAIDFSTAQRSANKMTITVLSGLHGPMTNRARGNADS